MSDSTEPAEHRTTRLLGIRRALPVIVAAGSLALLTGGVAVAQSGTGEAPEETRQVQPHRGHGRVGGTVATVDGTTFTVTGRDGEARTVTTTAETRFFTRDDATVADATVGTFVVVHGERAEDGTVTARGIGIRPAPEGEAVGLHRHHHHGVAGTVSANDGTTLTITTDEGDVTVTTTDETVVLRHAEGSIADVVVGASVHAGGVPAEDGSIAAEVVHINRSTQALPGRRGHDGPPPQPGEAPAEESGTVEGSSEAPGAGADPAAGTAPSAADPAAAAGEQSAERRRHWGAGGTVATVDGSTFTVTGRDGETTTVATTDATRYLVTTDATVADATVGSLVAVGGRTGDDGTVDARFLSILPGALDDGVDGDEGFAGRHGPRGLVGTVTANDGTTLTISTTGGDVTVVTDAETTVVRTAAGSAADVVVGVEVHAKGDVGDDGVVAAEVVHVLLATAVPGDGDHPSGPGFPGPGPGGEGRGPGGPGGGPGFPGPGGGFPGAD